MAPPEHAANEFISDEEHAEESQAPSLTTGPTIEDCRWVVDNLATKDDELGEPPSTAASGLLVHAKLDASILRAILDRALPKVQKVEKDAPEAMLASTGIEEQLKKEFGQLYTCIKYGMDNPEVVDKWLSDCKIAVPT